MLVVGGKRALAEEMEAGDAEPLRARINPAARLAIAPRRAGAGVEQNAGHREVEADPGDLRARLTGEPARQRGPAIDAADAEVPPAAVERDGEIGIVRAD